MARFKFTRDSAGIESILKSIDFGQADAAEAIAATVRSSKNAEVVVDTYTTDRLAASVTVRDVRGRGWEVRDGLLARAAGEQGLEVKRSAGDA